MTTATIQFLLPEIIVIAAAIGIYMVGAFCTGQKAWVWLAAAGIAVAMACLGGQNVANGSGNLISDGFTLYIRWLILAFALLFVLFNARPLVDGGTPEALASLLLVIAGGMLVVSAHDLILLFVALELISIPTYILLYIVPGGPGCREAAAKYFFLSVLASALLLYGFSFIYGTAGTMKLDGIGAAMGSEQGMTHGFANLARLALLLTFAGLCFRLAAVPFHFYAPDVYQGTSNSNAALLSVIPKAAGLVVLVRLVWAAMPILATLGWQITMAVAILTMILGNTLALWQDNPRRMMAYSSIAHAGYMLIGLSAALAAGTGPAGAWDGIGAISFYLCVYGTATIGTFALLEYLGEPQRQIESIGELAGMGRTQPMSAAMMAVFMFSLTGIPPLTGFWGKLLVFGSALNVVGQPGGGLTIWFVILAIVGVVNAAISAGYYLRIVGIMYFRSPSAECRSRGGWGAILVAVVCAMATVIIGLCPGPLAKASRDARPTVLQAAAGEKGR
jgi:NADH-quinone oxidoreductase subunit N